MADGSPGITMRQLAWAHDWHIPRSDIPPRSPFSSTPRYNCLANIFPAGGHAEAIGDLNVRYGSNPGAKFYRFTSDQYGAFYIVADRVRSGCELRVIRRLNMV
ncbi:hypothetical protein LZK74_03355 [Sinorhizobium meliloti]|nr:hypothetical protein LZK74_03355 [Sinorhizobium meliloti]